MEGAWSRAAAREPAGAASPERARGHQALARRGMSAARAGAAGSIAALASGRSVPPPHSACSKPPLRRFEFDSTLYSGFVILRRIRDSTARFKPPQRHPESEGATWI